MSSPSVPGSLRPALSSSESPPPKRPRLSSPTSAADDPAESGVHLDETYRYGNFTVVTADEVTFRVNDFLLFAYSPVLAEAHNLAHGERRVVLFDDELESAEIFRLFLGVVTTLKYRKQLPGGFYRLDKFLLFLDKWECTALFDLVFDSAVRKPVSDPSDTTIPAPLQYFHLASRHGHRDVCCNILWCGVSHSKRDKWWDEELSLSPYDPRGWTLRFWQENAIPPKYLHTLVQAYHISEEEGCLITEAFAEGFDDDTDG